MNNLSALNQIPPSGAVPSIPELLFFQRQTGKIDDEEYQRANAAWHADNQHKYHPRHYPLMTPTLSKYVGDRLTGKGSRDQVLCFNLSTWFREAVRVLAENSHEMSDFAFSKTKLEGLGHHVAKLDQAIARFAAVIPPYGMLERADWALQRDREIKGRSGNV